MTPDGDGVSQRKEENELVDKKENTTKQEKIENEEAKKQASKDKVEVEVSENDKTAVDSKDKGRFPQSEIFKNIFCCLREREPIGKKIFPQLIIS